jgi:hypothetical protein
VLVVLESLSQGLATLVTMMTLPIKGKVLVTMMTLPIKGKVVKKDQDAIQSLLGE